MRPKHIRNVMAALKKMKAVSVSLFENKVDNIFFYKIIKLKLGNYYSAK